MEHDTKNKIKIIFLGVLILISASVVIAEALSSERMAGTTPITAKTTAGEGWSYEIVKEDNLYYLKDILISENKDTLTVTAEVKSRLNRTHTTEELAKLEALSISTKEDKKEYVEAKVMNYTKENKFSVDIPKKAGYLIRVGTASVEIRIIQSSTLWDINTTTWRLVVANATGTMGGHVANSGLYIGGTEPATDENLRWVIHYKNGAGGIHGVIDSTGAIFIAENTGVTCANYSIGYHNGTGGIAAYAINCSRGTWSRIYWTYLDANSFDVETIAPTEATTWNSAFNRMGEVGGTQYNTFSKYAFIGDGAFTASGVHGDRTSPFEFVTFGHEDNNYTLSFRHQNAYGSMKVQATTDVGYYVLGGFSTTRLYEGSLRGRFTWHEMPEGYTAAEKIAHSDREYNASVADPYTIAYTTTKLVTITPGSAIPARTPIIMGTADLSGCPSPLTELNAPALIWSQYTNSTGDDVVMIVLENEQANAFTVDCGGDDTPPTWDQSPTDESYNYGVGINITYNATDNKGIENIYLNDTSIFKIGGCNGTAGDLSRACWLENVSITALGNHYLNVTANDTSGNTLGTEIKISVLSVSPGTPTLSQPLVDYNISGFYSIAWTDGAYGAPAVPFGVHIHLLNGSDGSFLSEVANISDGTESYFWNTSEHPDSLEYSINIYSCDQYGCSGNDTSGNFSIDNTYPNVTVFSPPGNTSTFRSGTINVNVSFGDLRLTGVLINITKESDGTSVFSFTNTSTLGTDTLVYDELIALSDFGAEGNFSILFRADDATQQNTTLHRFQYDASAPVINASLRINGNVDSTNAQFLANVTENGTGIQVVYLESDWANEGVLQNYSMSCGAGDEYSFNTTTLSSGSYTWRIIAVDGLNNTGLSATQGWTAYPTTTGASPGSGPRYVAANTTEDVNETAQMTEVAPTGLLSISGGTVTNFLAGITIWHLLVGFLALFMLVMVGVI